MNTEPKIRTNITANSDSKAYTSSIEILLTDSERKKAMVNYAMECFDAEEISFMAFTNNTADLTLTVYDWKNETILGYVEAYDSE